MFRRLIDELRRRGPLERHSSEVNGLLLRSLTEWTGRPPLIAREGAYTRTCAYRGAQFEVLLLGWAPGAASEIHDHGGQHCWMAVIEGRLAVDDYVRLDPGDVPGYAHVERRDSRTLGPGDFDMRSGRFDLHRVAAGGSKAVSLHLYARPLKQFLVYDEERRLCRPVSGTYDAVLQPYSQVTA